MTQEKLKCSLCTADAHPWTKARDGRVYWRCDHCELVFLHHSQLPNPERELARYREHNNVLADPEYMVYLSRLANPVLSAFNRSGGHGLDFGCGPVRGMAHLLQDRGHVIDSYDPYFFPEEHLLKNSYDFILASEVVEHLFQPGEGFAQLFSMLKPGGILGISSRLYPADPAVFREWSYRRDPTHVCFFGPKAVEWISARWPWRLISLEDPIWLIRK